mmetsp:Transcript_37326/g.90682  ORF Transcript_37326/g.90682 Transcript_37326/m.90682 type:complete len:80 (+) Transcript_37326:31-270(+)
MVKLLSTIIQISWIWLLVEDALLLGIFELLRKAFVDCPSLQLVGCCQTTIFRRPWFRQQDHTSEFFDTAQFATGKLFHH